MPTRVLFETATIADCLRKVQRCIPANGQGFDINGAGIFMEIRPGMPVVVKGTNNELFYTEWVDALEIHGDPVDWRLPGRFADLVGALPMISGSQVTFEDSAGVMKVTQNRISGTLRLIEPSGYPAWSVFDDTVTLPVATLGDKIAQVSWACHPQEAPLSGIYLDGKHMVATKRSCAARVPCEAPALANPVVAPLKLLGQVIRNAGDVRIGLLPTQIAVCPDEYSQIRCVTYGEKYPNVGKALMTDYETSLRMPKKTLMDSVSRLNTITKSKTSLLQIMIGAGEVSLMIRGLEREEKFEDSFTLESGGQHVPTIMRFDPSILLEGIGKGTGDSVELHYNLVDPKANRIPVYVSDGMGYEAWFMQRAEVND